MGRGLSGGEPLLGVPKDKKSRNGVLPFRLFRVFYASLRWSWRRSAIMAMNSELVGLPLALETV